MNRQARVLFNFIFSSGSDSSLALQDTSAQRSYYQNLIYSLVSHSIYIPESFQNLGRQLEGIARHAYIARQIDAVEQASRIMLDLPGSSQLKSVARHYQALCAKQKGDFDGARKLLERVVEEAPLQYKTRALQAIGATYHEQGEIDAALPFYIAAGKAAIDCDPITLCGSQKMIAIVRSIHGDHKQALDDFERLFPLIRAIGKYYPAFYYEYLNGLAVELGEVGRLDEARNVCQIALASPFAPAYPEFAETRDELEAKRTSATPSIVALSQASPKAKPTYSLARIQPAREKASIQTSIAITVTVIAHLKIHAIILERVRHSIYARSPPARR
jgi:tetratricopeptide (TPR) repeat protein